MDRKFLRKKIQQVIKDANIPGIGQDVFTQRSIPSDIDRLPIALVYSKSISVERLDESPKRYLKDLQIMIEVVTQCDTDEELADEIDDLSVLAEKAVEDSFELEDCTEYINLKTIVNDSESDGQSPVGSSILTFTIGYVTEPRQGLLLPDLKTLSTKYKMNETENIASDIIDVTGV